MPSSVNHVQSELSRMLSRVLDSPKLVAELLKEEDKETAEAFINTYVNTYNKEGKRTKDGKNISVITNFPQTLEANTTLIFVGNGSGEEINTSVGQVEGEFTFNSNGITTEKVKPTIEATQIKFELSSGIGELQNIVELDVDLDNIIVDKNTVTINLPIHVIETLGISENQVYTIRYEQSLGDTFGTVRGFTALEVVQVVPISHNLDTIRLLDTIIKAVLIMLRSTKEETSIYQMSDISYSAIQPQESIPGVENIMFGRQIDIKYQVSYGVDNVVLDFLKEVEYHQNMVVN